MELLELKFGYIKEISLIIKLIILIVLIILKVLD